MTWVKILAGLAKKGGQYIVQHPGIDAFFKANDEFYK
jgi:hypothetical protein